MSDTTVADIAIRIRQIVGRQNVEEIGIVPLKYRSRRPSVTSPSQPPLSSHGTFSCENSRT
jgi:hypothetical protein